MKYSNAEKLSIITRYQQGENVATLSDELDIPRSTLYRWLKSFPTDSTGKPLKFSYQEYALLQRKVEKLQNTLTVGPGINGGFAQGLGDVLVGAGLVAA